MIQSPNTEALLDRHRRQKLVFESSRDNVLKDRAWLQYLGSKHPEEASDPDSFHKDTFPALYSEFEDQYEP